MNYRIFNRTLLSLIAAVFVLAGCNNRLEIEPPDYIDAGKALSTANNIESAVIGTYAIVGGPGLYGGDVPLVGDLLANDNYMRWRGTFSTYRAVSGRNMVANNGTATRTWTEAYRAINMANNVIKSLSVVTDTARQNQLRGEASMLRGMMYFELVRLFAKPWVAGTANNHPGVPLTLKGYTSLNDPELLEARIPRATVAEVYSQVLADLQLAAKLLPESNGSTEANVKRANTYTASAFLARVYLQQSNWAGAANAADRVIKSGLYTLNPAVSTVFNVNNTAESIYEVQQNQQNNAGSSNDGTATFYANLPEVGRGDVEVLAAFYNTYDNADRRKTELFYMSPDGSPRPGRRSSGKWRSPFKNYPILRLSEMYLIRAEANFRLNNKAQAIADINVIRNRAGLPNVQDVTLESILTERQLELAFEGHRIHDIKRTQGKTGAFNYDSPKLILPIPQRELDANGNLTQNEGY